MKFSEVFALGTHPMNGILVGEGQQSQLAKCIPRGLGS